MKEINKQTADSSSSEDEAFTNVLRESIDQQFLHDDLYSAEKAKITQPETVTNKKSLRTSSRQEDKFMNFYVTPTFRSYIAEKLGEILERSIELKSSEASDCRVKRKRRKDKSYGIKLLSTSKKMLTAAKEIEEEKLESTKCGKRFKRNKQIASDTEDDEDLSKFREIAVDADYILSKVETESWVNRRPEPEFKYKRLKNGTLVEI